MLIQTPEGKCRVDDALVLCIDQDLTRGECAYVTVYLFTGEQITGMVEQSEPLGDLIQLRMAASIRQPKANRTPSRLKGGDGRSLHRQLS
jgi:hypothetical protein